jgi:Holliday junction resolvasome RuvABC endonuclease subunit
MNILALDTATKTGWALYVTGQETQRSGVQEFALRRGESPGMRFLRFRAWLREMHELANKIDVVVYEQAHHRGGAATQLCVGMVTDVLAWAADIGAETMPIHTGALKKFATGKGNAGKSEMVKAARGRGYDPEDDNAADACLLLEYVLADLRP